ncbi:tenascin isoform X2 [Brienomyrus brachyistius]|uniref:tenascin isoform X2 n=1 Tax=Brienomyrus brachyistius TaxID=42636 RepID=UPI0020B3409F|nr:tenascin isoform X2 [Brienomyrus brachyistius]
MLVIPYLLLFAHPFPALFTMTNAEKSQMVNDPLGNHKSPKTIIAGLNSQGTDHKPTSSSMKPPQGTVQRTIRNTSHRPAQNPIKVLISDTCIKQDTQGDSGSSAQYQGKELDLDPGSPLVLTHRISLVPRACDGGCDADYEALRGRLEKLEREVSTLREKCGDAEGGCCKRGTGAACNECPNDCSDQGRCIGGKCICFPGFTGPDCSSPTCPSNCNRGKCVNGQCVCNPGFLGPDCSEKACPNNCNNRGRCVNGKCVCDSGFTGLYCSEKACSSNCNNRGQCVNGKCVCDSGFTGLDCSEKACPNNCNNRGRCMNGKCVCDPGFTGLDCFEKACPNNCSNRGRCVNGKCVCDSGFTALDCSEMACHNNCNNRGRCVNGKCVCDPGFTGLDCFEKACPNNCSNRGRCVNGKCVCDSGFTALDCSEMACHNNCNNRGRCVNGKCVCDSGFTGLDCSEKACPNNCNNRGRCMNGKCVCDPGFTGLDCFEKACPNNCSNRGRCVNGKCVCDSGFTALDCSEMACPNNCNNRGRCLNGKCMCDSGFTGLDCSEKACPGNCNNRGRCMKGKCLCRRGFTGSDCGQCEAGFSGSDCSTALSAVTQLRTRHISESAVTVSWTPPSIQYDRYHVTFTSKKEGDQRVTTTVAGHLSSFTQTGLAAGQEYTVTIRGEEAGTMGQESSTVFTTLISGPKNLHVVKTTTTTAVVQWEPPQGDIDRYHLSVSPSQTDQEGTGAGSKNRTLPPDRNSAHIESLEAGRLYNISLVAQKGRSHSQPVTVQVIPGLKLILLRKPKAQYNGTSTIRRGDQMWPKQPGYKQPLGQKNQINESMLPTMGKKEKTPTVALRNLGKGPVKGLNTTQRPTNEDKPLPCNEIRSYILKKPGSQHRNTAAPEGVKSPARRNGTETHIKKCVKKVKVGPGMASGNGTMVGKDLGGRRPTQHDFINGSSGKKIYAIDRTDASKTATFLKNGTIVKSKTTKSSSLDTPQTTMNYTKQVFTTGPMAKAPSATDSSQVYRPQSPTDLPPSFSSSSLPSTSFSYSSRKTMKDTQEPSANQLTESHPMDLVTSSVSLSTIPLYTLAPSVQEAQTHSSVLEKNERIKKLPIPRQPNGTVPWRRPHMAPLYNGTRPIHRHPHHPPRGPLHRPKFPILNKGTNGRVVLIPKERQLNDSISQTDSRTKIIHRKIVKINNITDGKIRQALTNIGHELPTSKASQINKAEDTEGGEENIKVGQSNKFTNDTKREDPGLHSLGMKNVTSRGFVLIWEAPKGMFEKFIINQRELKEGNLTTAGKERSQEEEIGDDNKQEENEETSEADVSADKGGRDLGTVSSNKSLANVSKLDISSSRINGTVDSLPGPQSSLKLKVQAQQKFPHVVPGTTRSLQFTNLHPKARYNISLYGTGPGIRSKVHHLVINTGPEPPSDLTFSNATDSSFSVSWKKPTSPVTGFKVTYIHTQDEPISLSLKSHQTTVRLSALTPGSLYEVSVISTLDMNESDPVKGLAVTAPDPPTDLRVINISDSQALLLWRPALASVDQYIIVYGPEKGSDVTLMVTGNTAEQQLRGLKGSTVYAVTVSSKLGEQHSRAVSTRFTTAGAGGRGEGPRDLKASQVTPRSAVLSWKAPTTVVSGYKLTYQTAGQGTKEVILDGSVTQYKLRRLSPASLYIARLQGERQGLHTAAVSTDFTTGTLRFPFPTDCSQELLNGIPDSDETEIFPNGNRGPSALVYCDMETEGGGWTVIQRRMDGTTNFFRRWKEYSAGFGNISGEFWIGNELLHNLTQMVPMTMRVDLRSGSEAAYARYSSFSIDSARRHYAIKVSGYSGTAGDSMKYHNGRPFSTRDRDPYPFITRCAMSYRGGWWYKNCHEANLNGLYDTHTNHQGVIWTEWKGKDFSIPFTEMKIRPTSFTPPSQP